MRLRLGLLLGTAFTLAAPAAASAASTDVSITSSLRTLTVRGAANSTNAVAVSANIPNNRVLVTDTGSGVATNDAPCTTLMPGTIACPLGLLTKIEVTLGNRNDSAVISTAVPSSIPTSLDGGLDDDVLFGGNGADTLSGSNDTDFIDGGAGADTFRGGSGRDTVSYSTRTSGVGASLGGPSQLDGGAEDGAPGSADTINGDVENLIGGAGYDYLLGDGDSNNLFGGAGFDLLVGQSRGDFLSGGDGADFLIGNSGDDILVGGPGADGLRGNRDFDRLFAFDGERDAGINCGPGRDRAFRDAVDPKPRSCKKRNKRRRR